MTTKLCKDCFWYRKSLTSNLDRCANHNTLGAINLVTGYRLLPTCQDMRYTVGSVCGQAGNLFEKIYEYYND